MVSILLLLCLPETKFYVCHKQIEIGVVGPVKTIGYLAGDIIDTYWMLDYIEIVIATVALWINRSQKIARRKIQFFEPIH